MDKRYFLAIDIGASSGRHILAHLENDKLVLEEVYRFKNGAEDVNGKLVWNHEHLFNSIVEGLKKCKELDAAGKSATSFGYKADLKGNFKRSSYVSLYYINQFRKFKKYCK